MCPTPHHVTCASCGVRWWRLCDETEDDFARRVRQFPPCCANYAPPA